MKNVSVLGSTGSIGKQTLEVAAANPDKIKIRALAAHTSDVLLEEQEKRVFWKWLRSAKLTQF